MFWWVINFKHYTNIIILYLPVLVNYLLIHTYNNYLKHMNNDKHIIQILYNSQKDYLCFEIDQILIYNVLNIHEKAVIKIKY